MVANYIPQKGDIVWVNLSDTLGHEQSGKRPALVVSNSLYNSKSHLCLVCPITSKVKNYPFEVLIRSENINGVVLTDSIKSIDYVSRKIKKCSVASKKVLDEVKEKISILLS